MGPFPYRVAASRESGFTLIEIAVVLLIVVVLLTLGASIASVATDAAAHSETRRKQDVIRDALSTYLGKYKRLPCPDPFGTTMNGSGDDNRATAGDPATACTSDVGAVPYVDLGIARDMAVDGWQNLFTYRVTTDPSVTLDWTRSSTTFIPGKAAKLIVNRRNTDGSITTLTGSENAVVVLVSHGKNGLGAWNTLGKQNVLAATTADEYNNSSATTTYISRDISDAPILTFGSFDDVVTYLKASDLIAPLVKDGTVRTAEGETNYQIGVISDDVMSRYLATTGVSERTVPPPAGGTTPPRGLTTDGWGQAFQYFQCTTVQITSTDPVDPNKKAYRILSWGPGRTSNTTTNSDCTDAVGGDDVVFEVTVGTLRTLWAKAGKILP